jgi:ParB family chromosome partitioning protein
LSAEKARRLGRGLEALIQSSAAPAANSSDLQRIPIARIRPNPYQPRREFDPAQLAELEASLKASGLLQPITVRRRGEAFELVAGERRLRAATNLGWTEIMAVVRDFDDQTMLVLALVENLQRANLNPIEEARGYRRLLEDFKLTQQQVADAVGKDRTTITNLLRVLSLPDSIQQMVESASLSLGHARALLALGSDRSATDMANRAIAERLSVRELEQLVRDTLGAAAEPEKKRQQPTAEPVASKADAAAVRRIEDDLRRYLQTDASLKLAGGSKGHIQIAFYSGEDLERILDLILHEARQDF